MIGTKLETATVLALQLLLSSTLVVGCSDDRASTSADPQISGITDDTDGIPPPAGDGDGDGDDGGDGDGDWNPGSICEFPEPNEPPGCASGDACGRIDVLIVVDNSATMGEEQLVLGAAFAQLVEQLHGLVDVEGQPLNPDVNIMVTSTDVGHPSCTPLQPEGYEPLHGAPQQVPCTERLDDFSGLGDAPTLFPEACTDSCPVAVAPADPFVHFEGFEGSTTNVPGNQITAALGCIGPQGINGCDYEAPLEAMFRALDPKAAWNEGNKPFLRDGVTLAVVFITDEADCSVRDPEGLSYFGADDSFWELDPDTGTKTRATSAVCWNAGVDCGEPDMDGVYPDCTSLDTGALHPIERYLEYLEDELMNVQNKAVVMLGIVGVPPVTEHAPAHVPIVGGVADLLYRDWIDEPYPLGDILPGDLDAAHKQFEFGIGPGCTGTDDMGESTGQAIPPARLREVCEGLDDGDHVRCCLESVCDDDYSAAFACLGSVIQNEIDGTW